ncbi:MAG TPA: glycosyltransferase family 39 protein [Verrucomicrobiae bacterium]|nr:glycosyltransferase family 39 protein [Verrucomicrobiae bacterium]
MNIDGKRAGVLLILVLAAALGLRLFHLGQRVVWFDEANSLLVAQAAPAKIIAAARDDVHSALYYLTLHVWQFVVTGETGARMLSVLAAVATVAVVYFLGGWLAGRGAGLLSAGLLGLSPLHVWYSQEIRMYSVQTLLICLSFLFLLKALREGRGISWVAFVLCTALALYVQYTSIFAVLAQGVFVAVYYRKDRKTLWRWLLSQSGVVLLFAPCLPLLFWQTTRVTGRSWIQPLELRQVLGFISLFSGAYLGDVRSRAFSVLVTIAVLGTVVVILCRRRENRETGCLLTLWFALPIILLLGLSLRQNLFLPRTLVYTTPALALLVGCSLARTGNRIEHLTGALVAVALVSANLFALKNYYFSDNPWVKSDLREGTHEIARNLRAGDVIVHSSQFSYRPFQYYLANQTIQGVVRQPEKLSHLFAVIGDGQLPQNRPDLRRIWLVLYPDFKNQGFDEKVRDWMDVHHHFVQVLHNSPTLFIGLYERQGSELAPVIE